jgi:hypothetical protein
VTTIHEMRPAAQAAGRIHRACRRGGMMQFLTRAVGARRTGLMRRQSDCAAFEDAGHGAPEWRDPSMRPRWSRLAIAAIARPPPLGAERAYGERRDASDAERVRIHRVSRLRACADRTEADCEIVRLVPAPHARHHDPGAARAAGVGRACGLGGTTPVRIHGRGRPRACCRSGRVPVGSSGRGGHGRR